MDDRILDVSNIEVVYNHSVQVLRGLSLNVPRGEIVALLGSNGAGKSTTLKAIANVLFLEDGERSSGQIRFDGDAVDHRPPHRLVRDGLCHVMEGRRVFEDLTVEENLIAAGYARSGRGTSVTRDLVYEYFPQLYSRRRSLAGYLSGGEQQMLAIGRGLLGQPSMMLLDEPSLGLSPMLVEEIFTIIARINREQEVAMLLVEQNANVALALASYGYIMESGRVVIDGTPEKLMADDDVREFYLGSGGSEGEGKSYRDVKHYKRRKRWLS
ncbi:ABC transporter ATP-binding protein [Aquisalimonas lutea]|uniref:ABC transporter ATP-binding protein n=1 Tax=Aquisalimonas lutea TaxID=1327750 RepID=UPI0025B3E792|nr:ABC transporter ATP-binding protein [Aquisalimonas lutea]MDN3517630.1 ABC transporter ATP-binding protein [Aquisalimonas lutea]